MSEVLINNDYLSVEYTPEAELIIAVFKEEFGLLDEEALKEQLIYFSKVIDENSVRSVLFDFFDVHFALTEDLYEYVFSSITEHLVKNEVLDIAYIMPDDYISKLGMELFLYRVIPITDRILKNYGKEYLQEKIKRNIFNDRYQAKEWIEKRNK